MKELISYLPKKDHQSFCMFAFSTLGATESPDFFQIPQDAFFVNWIATYGRGLPFWNPKKVMLFIGILTQTVDEPLD